MPSTDTHFQKHALSLNVTKAFCAVSLIGQLISLLFGYNRRTFTMDEKPCQVDTRSRHSLEARLNESFDDIAVAEGVSALKISEEPTRTIGSSYGFLLHEAYNPELEAHRVSRPAVDPGDGEEYIDNTIDWVIQKVGFRPKSVALAFNS